MASDDPAAPSKPDASTAKSSKAPPVAPRPPAPRRPPGPPKPSNVSRPPVKPPPAPSMSPKPPAAAPAATPRPPPARPFATPKAPEATIELSAAELADDPDADDLDDGDVESAEVDASEFIEEAPSYDEALEAPVAAAPSSSTTMELLEELESSAEEPLDEGARKVAPGYVASAESLVNRCLAELERSVPRERQGRLHYEAARLLEYPLGRLDEAGEHFRRSSELLPDFLPALRGARRAARRSGDVRRALSLCDAELKLVGSPEDKARLLVEKSRLLEHAGGQPRAAVDALSSAVELAPGDQAALHGLRRLLGQLSDWPRLDRALGDAAAGSRDPRLKAAILVEQARLAEVRRKDVPGAIELYRRARDAAPRDLAALHALRTLYAIEKRWSDLATVLKDEAEMVSDPEVRSVLRMRLGELTAAHLDDLDGAIAALQAAAEEGVATRAVLEELARVCERHERYQDLVAVLARLLAFHDAPDERLPMLLRLAELMETRLADDARAIGWYQQALQVDPTYPPAVHGVCALFRRRRDYPELLKVRLAEAAALREPTRKAAAHEAIAELYDELGERANAITHHREALVLVPGHPPSFKALERLYAQDGAHRQLVELHERAIDLAETDEVRITYLFKSARLQEDALEDPAAAMVSYRRILDLEADRLEALHGLQRSAEAAGRHRELAAALEREAGLVDAVEARDLWLKSAQVHEHRIDDVDGALERYRRVLDMAPDHAPALAALGALFRRLHRWEDLLDVYRLELSKAPKDQRARLHHTMGRLCEDHLGDEKRAAECYREALGADRFHLMTLRDLGRLHARAGRWGELVKLLELELGILDDPGERSRMGLRIAEIYENRLQQLDRARSAYEQALRDDPELRPARDGCLRIALQKGDHKRVVQQLEEEADLAGDPVLVVAAESRRAAHLRDDLADAVAAKAVLQGILARDPGNLSALLALDGILALDGDGDALEAVLERIVGTVEDPGTRVGLLRELAQLRLERDADGDAALASQALLGVLQLDPSNRAALHGLEELALGRGDERVLAHVAARLGALTDDARQAAEEHVRLAELLETSEDPSALETYRAALARDPGSLAATAGLGRLAARHGDATLLREVGELEAEVGGDPVAAAARFCRAGELDRGAEKAEAAIAAFERALDFDPASEAAASALRDLRLGRREHGQLLDRIRAAARQTRDDGAYVRLSLLEAELLAEYEGDVPAALVALRKAELRAPSDPALLSRTADYLIRTEQWQKAADHLRRVVAVAPPLEVIVETQLKLAELNDERLDDASASLAALQVVLGLSPGHETALRRMVVLHERRGALDKAVEAAHRLAAALPEPSRRADVLTVVGRLEKQRGDEGAAVAAWAQAVGLAGLAGSAADALKEVIADQKQRGAEPEHRVYADALSSFVSRETGDFATVRRPAYLELARILDEDLNRTEQGLATLRRALNAAPDDVALRMDLAARLRASGHIPEASAELRAVLERDVLQADSYRQLAEIAAAQGRHDEAVAWLGPRVLLGVATPEERQKIAARPPRLLVAAPGSVGPMAFRQVDITPQPDPVTDLLAAITEGLPRVHTPELDRWGVGARDKIAARSGHPVRNVVDHVAALFGVADLDVYVHGRPGRVIDVEISDPVSLIVPGAMAQLPEGQLAFAVTRVVALIARGQYLAQRYDGATLRSLLAGAARLVDPAYVAPGVSEAHIAADSKRIQRAFSWRSRRVLDDAAHRYSTRPEPDITRWAHDVRQAAARMATVVTGDIVGPVEQLRRFESVELTAPLVADLMRFWVSEPAAALRRGLRSG